MSHAAIRFLTPDVVGFLSHCPCLQRLYLTHPTSAQSGQRSSSERVLGRCAKLQTIDFCLPRAHIPAQQPIRLSRADTELICPSQTAFRWKHIRGATIRATDSILARFEKQSDLVSVSLECEDTEDTREALEKHPLLVKRLHVNVIDSAEDSAGPSVSLPCMEELIFESNSSHTLVLTGPELRKLTMNGGNFYQLFWIMSSCPKLTHIKAKNVGDDGHYLKEYQEFWSLEHCPGLRQLELEGFDLTGTLLVEQAIHCSALETLRASVAIQDIGGDVIRQALARLTKLLFCTSSIQNIESKSQHLSGFKQKTSRQQARHLESAVFRGPPFDQSFFRGM